MLCYLVVHVYNLWVHELRKNLLPTWYQLNYSEYSTCSPTSLNTAVQSTFFNFNKSEKQESWMGICVCIVKTNRHSDNNITTEKNSFWHIPTLKICFAYIHVESSLRKRNVCSSAHHVFCSFFYGANFQRISKIEMIHQSEMLPNFEISPSICIKRRHSVAFTQRFLKPWQTENMRNPTHEFLVKKQRAVFKRVKKGWMSVMGRSACCSQTFKSEQNIQQNS